MNMNEPTGRAIGGKARMAKLTPEERKAVASKAAKAKAEASRLPQATHEGMISIGDVEIPCAVLPDGRRLLTQSGVMQALGRARQAKGRGYYEADVNLPAFLTAKNLKPFINNDLMVTSSQVEFKLKSGVRAFGYPAEILPKICDVYLNAADQNALTHTQQHIAAKAMVLMRGLAHVGIIALVDEATGFQKDRAKDALAKILEAFVTKELQPWVRTFPTEYYEQLFRLYGYDFPPKGNPQWRPQFFGKITSEVVYNRLAPDLLPELKKAASRAERKAKLHQWLSQDIGHPKLREHLSSIVTLMKLARSPEEFRDLVDRIHPRFGDNLRLDFNES
ncbi:P63C domain-containing protein [Thauera aromatica]|uniref:P63C domain-containing protein n=1 Tax=Thauera aromatica TaxID=59405 RepID=UPI001FFC9144|nr:P63C domain-containing protein [Thauera aromatica]MCK2097544.1 P63C domain-containing protein [Thauera aromatica]